MNQKLFALLQPKKVLPILMIVAFMLAFLAPSVSAEEKPAESAWDRMVLFKLIRISEMKSLIDSAHLGPG